MNKRKRKSAEQAPRPKDHSPEQVKEVALMLYAQRPFPLNSTLSEFELNWLVWRANDLLDKLNEVCGVVAEQRKAGKRSPEKKIADAQKAQKALPDVVPFKKAVEFITDQSRWDRAWKRFKVLPHLSTEQLLRQEPATPAVMKYWREQIAYWRKHKMKRDEVLCRRSLYDENAYRCYRIARRYRIAARRAKKRKPWEEKRMENAALESAARELKRQEKVKALRKAARTGEIE
jgi:hypothetical protein